MPFARLPLLIFLFPGKKAQKQHKHQPEHLHILIAAWLAPRVTTTEPSSPDSIHQLLRDILMDFPGLLFLVYVKVTPKNAAILF